MFKVLDAGFYTTIQDTGRFKYRKFGVPLSGAMDTKSAKIANSLLENDLNDALLEITMTGPTLEFEEPTFIALSGAEMSAEINGEPIDNYAVHRIQAGDILSYGKLESGFRSYLAVKGGIKTPKVLGSTSYFKSLTPQGHLKNRTEVDYEPSLEFEPKIAHFIPEPIQKEPQLLVYAGPELDRIDEESRQRLFNAPFTIAKDYNRMAYQLEETVNSHKIPMITSANLPGTVQLTPAGKLIILMRDGQTTGGYPRILQLQESAISILSQKKFGDSLRFKLI